MKIAAKSLVLITTICALASAMAGDAPAPTPAAPTPVPPATTPATAPSANGNPKIQFEMPIYEFGKVTAGNPIKYTFIFTNTGDASLDVEVHPLCGCTVAGEYDHKVEPGKTGSIPIQVNSANFAGMIDKMVNVNSNDKLQPQVQLHLKGTVWKPIDVNPALAYFNILPDAPSPAPYTVHIVNNTETNLTLTPPESQNPAFSAQLKTNEPGKSFDLIVSVTPPQNPGNVNGLITMKTSFPTMPVISITAMANLQAAVTIIPGAITLPPAPLAKSATNMMTIQNFGTNLLVLSEPVVNAKGVEVRVKELNPGKVFSVAVVFPEGFELASDIPTELSIKSTHPKYPLIKAPVNQLPKPPLGPLTTPEANPRPQPFNSLRPPLPQPAAH